MLDLADKNLKADIITMSKQLKENMFKELQEKMITTNQQIKIFQ